MDYTSKDKRLVKLKKCKNMKSESAMVLLVLVNTYLILADSNEDAKKLYSLGKSILVQEKN